MRAIIIAIVSLFCLNCAAQVAQSTKQNKTSSSHRDASDFMR